MNKEKISKINSLKTIAECKNLELQARNQGDLAFAEAICERIYDISIDNLKSERECERFSINAVNNGRSDLVKRINRKSIDLLVEKYPGYASLREVEIESLKATYSYEKILRLKNGRRTRASYTWRSIKNHGIIGGIDRIVSNARDTLGFTHLSEMRLKDYSFEAIVLKYPKAFSNSAVEQASFRIGGCAS
jgi:hypothetical protein